MRTTLRAGLALLLAGSPCAWAAERDACGLLSDAEIRGVQGQVVTERVPGAQTTPTFRVALCFYRTTGVASSVSLALTSPRPGAATTAGPRQYWRETFHRAVQAAEVAAPGSPPRKHAPPRAIGGLGDEAYWVGDPSSGALYVLRGDAFVRVSVGGASAEERLVRSRTLAARALRRLR